MRPMLLGFACFFLFVAVSALFGKDCQRYLNRSLAEDALRTRVQKVLVAPASAQFREVRILEHSGSKYLGYVEVDAQNQFGAMLRNRWCIVVEIDPRQQQFYYGPEGSMMPCDGDNITKDVIAAAKGLNHWDEPDYWRRSAEAAAAAK